MEPLFSFLPSISGLRVVARVRSIVNGLRDDDGESVYDGRASFTSEYSAEGVKVFFKEHGRKASKSSNTSLLSRKKQQPSASQRPETKVRIASVAWLMNACTNVYVSLQVFFSSTAQIGRLIENLSRDKEAGSFNITPERQNGPTPASPTGPAFF